MKWKTIHGEGLRCTACGHTAFIKTDDECDLFYFPEADSMTREQTDQIADIWNVDPYADFLVCHNCLDGHDPMCRAHDWLDELVKEAVKIQRGVVRLDDYRLLGAWS